MKIHEVVTEMIRKLGDNKWRLCSSDGKKNVGTFPNRAAAERHEREVQYFRHLGEDHMLSEYTEFDLHHEFYEEIAQLDTGIFESGPEYQKLKSFLQNFDTTEPRPGNRYVYASVASTPAARILNLAHFSTPHELVDVANGKYVFEVAGKRRTFPEQGRFDRGDSYQQIFVFENTDEFEQMANWISLSYNQENSWNVSYKQLDQ